MGRHAAPDLDVDPLDMPSTQQPTEWWAMVEGPTEPIARRRGGLRIVVMMLLAAGLSAILLVRVVAQWPGRIGFGTGLMLIGLVVVPYLVAMLGMLLLHWREL